MLRTFITFDADFPDDAEFAASGDIVRPGGNAIMIALADALGGQGYKLSELVQHSFYGWAFTTGKDGEHYLILQFAGPWLLQAGIQDAAGRPVEEADRAFVDLLHTCHHILLADSRFHNIRWFTREEYDKSAPGRASP